MEVDIITVQITQALVKYLQNAELNIDHQSIRAYLDVSEVPVGDSGCTVSVSHRGAYGNAQVPDYPLHVFEARVKLYTHLDTDRDSSLFNELSAALFEKLSAFAYTPDGWLVDGRSGWNINDIALLENYRAGDFTCTFYLERI